MEPGHAQLAEVVGRASDRYVRTHRQGSMATVSAMILFDALRRDLQTSGRRSVTMFSRPQLRDLMAAHPAWEGKAFEETSFNTVPEDLGEQLEQFVHEDFTGGRNVRIRFRGPTRKFRQDKSSKELYLEFVEEPVDAVVAPRSTAVWLAAAAAILLVIAIAFVVRSRRATTIAAPRNATLAILPFRLLGNDEQLRFLGVGIADGVITRLSNIEIVRVRPTTAILPYERGVSDLQRAGRDLGADYLVSGTLQSAGDRLRAAVQLIRVDDGAAIFGQRFDVPRTDLLSLEDTISDRVAASLQPRLTAEQRARLTRRFTSNPVAYEHYLRGRAAMLLVTPEGTGNAIKEFEQAIATDPSYALARAGLANAEAQMRIRFAPKSEIAGFASRAKQEAEEALRLAPDLAEAHEALAGVVRYDEFDWEKVMEESARAIALNANLELAHDYRAAAAYHLGLLDLAAREARTAMDINPQRPIEAVRINGVVSMFKGDYVQSLALLREVAARTDIADYYLGLALYYTGRPGEAEELLRRMSGGETRNARAAAALASILAATGKRDVASRILKQIASGSTIDHHVAYSMGVAYAQLGDPSKAVHWLTEATRIGFPCYPWFARDPLLQALRSDARFTALLESLRSEHDRWSARYGDQVAPRHMI